MGSISNNIEVIDKALSPKDFTELHSVASRKDISWHYFRNYHTRDGEVNDASTHGFVHNFFDNNTVYSDHIKLLEPLFEKISVHFSCPITLVRIKMNMTLNVGKQVRLYPHIDRPEAVGNPNFKTAIYYVNDSDGDTLFFDETNVVIHRQTPKRNTLVVFDGSTAHAPQLPLIKPNRIVININVLLDR